MCIICVSTITAASLLSPSTAPVQVQNEVATTVNKTSVQEYQFTNKPCNKSQLNKISKNTICLKNGKVYKWAIKKQKTVKVEPKPYIPPTLPTSDINICKIKESNSARTGMLNPLASGFPTVSIAKKEGTVKWALIPLDFVDLNGENNFKSRIDSQTKLLSDWFFTVSDGKFKVEWVVLDQWVRLPKTTNEYTIDRSDNLDRVPNGAKLFNDAMVETDKVFDFTGIQTVNFILPQGQNMIQETLQGFPWDSAVKSFITNEGSISSFSIPGKFMDRPNKQYWSYWAHEFGHAMALPHIGSSREPNPFLGLDIMGNQDGESRELSGWLRFVAGWLSDNKVYCQELNKITNLEINLVPLNESTNGIKLVVIPTSESKAIIIESRRETKFSCNMPSKRNGVLVYTYESFLSHGQDFLKPLVPEGRTEERSLNCSVTPYPNPILYKGQKINIDGISIELIDSFNYDTIKITKL